MQSLGCLKSGVLKENDGVIKKYLHIYLFLINKYAYLCLRKQTPWNK